MKSLIVMQIAPEGTLPEPLPETGRSELPDIVPWEALDVTDISMTFRVLFPDAKIISAEEDSTDTLFITLDLADFKTEDDRYIPNGS